MDDGSGDVAMAESRGLTSVHRGATGEDVFQVLSDGSSVDDADLILEVKSRIRRSIEDPRPSLSLDQVDDFIDALVAKARADAGRD